jgi:hypothetical protein
MLLRINLIRTINSRRCSSIEDNLDDRLLLDQLVKWVPDATIRRKILVDNSQRLYGFPAVQPT